MWHFFTSKKRNPDLSFIGVELHNHILPGIDDGVQDEDTTIQFIERFQQLGFKKIIATPHIFAGVYPNTSETIHKAYESIISNGSISSSIEIAYAAEYMVDIEFESMLQQNENLLTFGKKQVLIEMSYAAPSPNIEQVVFALQLAGYQPVLAHPERYNFYHQQPKAYQRMLDMGCQFQLNILSLTNYYGPQVKKQAHWLLKKEMYQWVGSDCHHDRHLKSLEDLASTKECYELLENYPFFNKTLLSNSL